MKNFSFKTLACALLVFAASFLVGQAETKPTPDFDEAAIWKKAQKLQSDGNYNEAYDLYRKLVLSAATDPEKVGAYLQNATGCLS